MIKTIMAAAVAAFTLAACSGNSSTDTTSSRNETSTRTCECCATGCAQQKHPKHHRQDKRATSAAYSGILPAADTDGIRYTLRLDYDDDGNFVKGEYDLVEEYLEADGRAPGSYKTIKRIESEGDFTVMTEATDDKTGKHLRLMPDADSSDAEAATEPIYFRIDGDSSVTLVNADLEESANPELNYTLTATR